MSFGESARLSHERPIGDGGSTVSHIARFEKVCRLIRLLHFNPTITINKRVHRLRLIVTVITLQMDGCD